MIKFTTVPKCKKCGNNKFTWSLYNRGALDNTDTPKEFLVLTCKRCRGNSDMHTKDYVAGGE